jgi:hypothetical protein
MAQVDLTAEELQDIIEIRDFLEHLELRAVGMPQVFFEIGGADGVSVSLAPFEGEYRIRVEI